MPGTPLLAGHTLHRVPKFGCYLFAVAIACVIVLTMLGALPSPVTGEAAGRAVGSLFFIWVAACVGAARAAWIADPRHALTAGTIVAMVHHDVGRTRYQRSASWLARLQGKSRLARRDSGRNKRQRSCDQARLRSTGAFVRTVGEEADAPEGPSEAPATPAAEETTTDAGAPITEAGGETQAEITPADQPANDNAPAEPAAATGTDG